MRSVLWVNDADEEQPLMFQTPQPVFLTAGIIQGCGQSQAGAHKESVPLNLRSPDIGDTVKSAILYTERAIRKLLPKGEIIPAETDGDAPCNVVFIGIHPRYECEGFEVNTTASQFEEKPLKAFKGVQGKYLLLFQMHSIFAPKDSSVWKACFAARSITRVVDATEQALPVLGKRRIGKEEDQLPVDLKRQMPKKAAAEAKRPRVAAALAQEVKKKKITSTTPVPPAVRHIVGTAGSKVTRAETISSDSDEGEARITTEACKKRLVTLTKKSTTPPAVQVKHIVGTSGGKVASKDISRCREAISSESGEDDEIEIASEEEASF